MRTTMNFNIYEAFRRKVKVAAAANGWTVRRVFEESFTLWSATQRANALATAAAPDQVLENDVMEIAN